ncbi:S1/P1 nuclease [Tenacibaculum finnmarkense]|uniref:S1/P1 nuclease n=1 Tax=Tenacibaculum finnmarkense TaxID=2781243 RepID=UPI001EFBEE80|nr:S1/P1 nuclease [Tenacibaculum finnmarkense]MCG8795237.1 S1/P1 nuclease [Tenacibaculum finnmarkense]MCG8797564.1 S1/P1 nuclease [Tenacibaculum finnmarkense]
MKLKVLVLFCVFLISTSAIANNEDFWGQTGHRATGEIAQNNLTKKAKRQIDKLLQGESLAFVSTYADEIKSDRKKFGKFYTWHYINMPLDAKYSEVAKNPKGDLITGIEACVKILKDKNSSIKDKRFYLKMLVHLIGDLHQPLHIGQKENKGGNAIQVQWHGKGSNLHRVWDGDLINMWDMSYLELADNAKRLSKEQIKVLQKGTVIDWMQDTHTLTKKVYGSVKTGDKLSYRYSYDYFPVVREQLQKGGLRLAKLLNEIFC